MKRRAILILIVLLALGAVIVYDKYAVWAGIPDDVARVTFADLAGYEYVMPSAEELKKPDRKDQIPADIRALDGKKVALEGWMVALESDGGRVHTFVISRYIGGCCYGQQPNTNEWANVDVVDPDGCEYLHDRTVIALGTLEVGEKIDKHGYVESLYRLKADEVREGGPVDLNIVGWAVALALFFLLTAPIKKKKKGDAPADGAEAETEPSRESDVPVAQS